MLKINVKDIGRHLNTDLNIKLLRELTETEQFQLKHFCKQHKQSLPNQKDLGVLLFLGSKLIGWVRLIVMQPNEHYWLRSLFIAPEYRRQGYARWLMLQLPKHLQTATKNISITLFALAHLNDFYQNLNYRPVDFTQLPETLKDHWNKAQNEGKDWVLLQQCFD